MECQILKRNRVKWQTYCLRVMILGYILFWLCSLFFNDRLLLQYKLYSDPCFISLGFCFLLRWYISFLLPCNKLPQILVGFPCGSAGKESACNSRDLGSIRGWGRSPGEGKGYPLQYSGLKKIPACIVYGFAKSQTRLSDFHFHFFLVA